MKEVENFETVFINTKIRGTVVSGDGTVGNPYVFDGDNSFTYDIDINFPVDEIILKYISITDGHPQDPPPKILKSSLVRNMTMLAYPSTHVVYESLNIPYHPASRYIKGNHKFYLHNAYTNELINPGGEIQINMCLLFVKYKDSK